MFIVAHFLNALAVVVDYVLVIYMWIIVARAVISWVNADPYNQIVRFIHNVTEPALYQIRTRLPVTFSGIDMSPIVVFLAIIFLRKFLVGSLYGMAAGLM